MEISLDNVVGKFQLYSGEALDGSDARRDQLCKALCGECVGWVKRLLLPDAPEDAAGDAESLAAAEAYYQLALLDQAAGPASFSSPELKVELGDRAARAGELCDAKRKACRAVLPPEDFYFAQA